jgi:hypothetical protein
MTISNMGHADPVAALWRSLERVVCDHGWHSNWPAGQ